MRGMDGWEGSHWVCPYLSFLLSGLFFSLSWVLGVGTMQLSGGQGKQLTARGGAQGWLLR